MKKDDMTIREEFERDINLVAGDFQKIVLHYINLEGASNGSAILLEKCHLLIDKMKDLSKCDLKIFDKVPNEVPNET